MEQLPEDIDLAYSYISYEVIDEPIFLQDETPLVNMSTIIRDYNQEVETIARILDFYVPNGDIEKTDDI